ncbi:helix-turn-helix transcriptional regulator [Mycoplasma sp. P36-A1]|uniref:helix-turn-helix transcriptional regulator n=1 Tax=Mycoplasma sp. P36-A1 TaxID=3252900 RepID=UPI003C30047A
MNLIKEYRLKRGLTQNELANEANISFQYISLIENGERNPSINTAKKIAKILKIPKSKRIKLYEEFGKEE